MRPIAFFVEKNVWIRILRRPQVPAWASLSVEHVEAKVLSAALTNTIFRVGRTAGAPPSDDDREGETEAKEADLPRNVLVRFYGSASFDRGVETAVFAALAESGLGKKLLASFEGGRIEEYIEGIDFPFEAFASAHNVEVVARLMGRQHSLDLPAVRALDGAVISVADRLEAQSKAASDLLAAVEGADGSDGLADLADKHPWFAAGANAGDDDDGGTDLKQLAREAIAMVPDVVARLPSSPVRFCHNDLHELNIILRDGQRAADPILADHVVFHDFEYGSFGERAYDLANTLCEMAIQNEAEGEPVGFGWYPDRVPTGERLDAFLAAYLEGAGEPSLPDDVAALRSEVTAYVLASHLHWGLWALSRNHDDAWSYDAYARTRLTYVVEHYNGWVEAVSST